MNIDALRERFPNEDACRRFLESTLWKHGRNCPRCSCKKSYHLSGRSARKGLYECAQCKYQFSVTSRTPMHSTKLPLWKWILTMFFMVNSSKGISSVYLAKLVGVSQKSMWKIGHAIRKMMDHGMEFFPELNGIVELDEKYVGGKPRHESGKVNPRGKGTKKQGVFVAVERLDQVRTSPIDSDTVNEMFPLVNQFVDADSHLMTDQLSSYKKIGRQYASHQAVNHSKGEYSRGNVHNNTAESFNSMVERAKQGVFHFWSRIHLQRYLHEIGFRWNHRVPALKKTRKGKLKLVMEPMPVMTMLRSLLSMAAGRQIRRSSRGGIVVLKPARID